MTWSGRSAIARRCEELGTPVRARRGRLGAAPDRPEARAHGRSPQIRGAEPLGRHAVLARAETSTPEGVRFSESHVAAHLGSPTVLIDITDGPAGAAEGIRAAAGLLGCDLRRLRRRRRRRDRHAAPSPGSAARSATR